MDAVQRVYQTSGADYTNGLRTHVFDIALPNEVGSGRVCRCLCIEAAVFKRDAAAVTEALIRLEPSSFICF